MSVPSPAEMNREAARFWAIEHARCERFLDDPIVRSKALAILDFEATFDAAGEFRMTLEDALQLSAANALYVPLEAQLDYALSGRRVSRFEDLPGSEHARVRRLLRPKQASRKHGVITEIIRLFLRRHREGSPKELLAELRSWCADGPICDVTNNNVTYSLHGKIKDVAVKSLPSMLSRERTAMYGLRNRRKRKSNP